MKRPLPYMLFFICVGIYLGYTDTYIDDIYLLVLFSILCGVVCFLVSKSPIALLVSCALLFGVSMGVSRLPKSDFNIDLAIDSKQQVTIIGRVISYNHNGDTNKYRVRNSLMLLQDGTEIKENFDIRLNTDQNFKRGDYISINSRIYGISRKMNPSDFDSELYMQIQNFRYSVYVDEMGKNSVMLFQRPKGIFLYDVQDKIDGIRDDIQKVFRTLFKKRQAEVLNAVITGDKSGIDDITSNGFRKAGIYHLLAISGLHISVLASVILFVFGKINRSVGYIVSVIFLWLYMLMTGCAVSVSRAVIMMHILIGGKMLHKNYDLINSTSFAGIVLLIINPLNIFNIGFLYSFGAVFGIAITMELLQKLKIKSKFVVTLGSAIGATTFTRLITLFNFYYVNIFEIIANLVVIPIMSIVIVLAFFVGFGGLVSLPFAEILAKPLSLMLDFVFFLSEKFGDMPRVLTGKPTTETMGCIIVVTLIYMLLLYKPKLKRLAVLFAFIPLPFIVENVTRDNRSSVNFMYVGQGDCCIINKNRSAYIIDCGGSPFADIGNDTGKNKILPFLNYSGIEQVKAVFISHSDTDHIKGLYDLFGNVKIKEIIVSDKIEKNENYFRMLKYAARYKVPIIFMHTNQRIVLGNGIVADCLYPYEEADSTNESSMVIKLKFEDTDFLFTGDISEKSELDMLFHSVDVKADVLKLAHHGSKNSNCVLFLKNVNPEYAIASAGINNSYKHPDVKTVETLKSLDIPLYVTCDEGMIKWVDGKIEYN